MQEGFGGDASDTDVSARFTPSLNRPVIGDKMDLCPQAG